MNQSMKIISVFVFLFASVASADLRVPIRPVPLPETPICRLNPNLEYVRYANKTLAEINRAIKCGDYEKSQALLEELYLTNEEVGRFGKGICYFDNNCKTKITGSLITKQNCKDTGGGSWAQVSPTSGQCVTL